MIGIFGVSVRPIGTHLHFQKEKKSKHYIEIGLSINRLFFKMVGCGVKIYIYIHLLLVRLSRTAFLFHCRSHCVQILSCFAQ